jgi:hypothetical protein
MSVIRANAWQQREKFTFDYHVDRLVEFFHQVIENKDYRGSRQVIPHKSVGYPD